MERDEKIKERYKILQALSRIEKKAYYCLTCNEYNMIKSLHEYIKIKGEKYYENKSN